MAIPNYDTLLDPTAYFNDSGQGSLEFKEFNLYQILQLDKDFFETYDEMVFKKHLRNLMRKYKQDGDLNKTIWAQIQSAANYLRIEKNRVFYLKNEIAPKADVGNTDLDKWLEMNEPEESSSLAALEERVNRHNRQAANADDNFAEILHEYSFICDQYPKSLERNPSTRARKVYDFFDRIKIAAASGDNYFQLAEFCRQYRSNQVNERFEFYQFAAGLRHPQSMVIVAQAGFRGQLVPFAIAVPWAITCLYCLHQFILPKLKNKQISTYEQTYRLLQEEKLGSVFPIPGTTKFNLLVSEKISGFERAAFSKKTIWFIISPNTFDRYKAPIRRNAIDESKTLEQTPHADGSVTHPDNPPTATHAQSISAALEKLRQLNINSPTDSKFKIIKILDGLVEQKKKNPHKQLVVNKAEFYLHLKHVSEEPQSKQNSFKNFLATVAAVFLGLCIPIAWSAYRRGAPGLFFTEGGAKQLAEVALYEIQSNRKPTK